MDIEKVLKDISEINLTGNVIPHTWYKHVIYTTEKKTVKADLLAINILADVVYWHRLTVIRDESTGQVVEYRKKFAGDKLQKSYNSYADQFGSAKKAVKESIDLLVELNLVKRDFENIVVRGMCVNNVMYLTPDPENIRKITQIESDIINTNNLTNVPLPTKKDGGTPKKVTTTVQKSEESITKKEGGGSEKVDTNTKISSEISAESFYLIVMGSNDDSDFRKAFNEFLIDDSNQYRDDTFFWINHNAQKYGASLKEVTQALKICTEKNKEGEMSYFTGILRKKAELKGQGVKGFGKNLQHAIYEYLKYKLGRQMQYIKNYDLDMENKILYFSVYDKEDKEAVSDLCKIACAEIAAEFDVKIEPKLRL